VRAGAGGGIFEYMILIILFILHRVCKSMDTRHRRSPNRVQWNVILSEGNEISDYRT
jgi:hypothetical protein